MNDKPFFDTNVLLYAIVRGDIRTEVSKRLLRNGGVISVQVLNEFIAVARRKFKMPWKEVREAVADLLKLCPEPAPITLQMQQRALRVAERYHYHIYDALVIATALEGSCRVLYSEDMQGGQVIEGLTIHNPFQSALT